LTIGRHAFTAAALIVGILCSAVPGQAAGGDASQPVRLAQAATVCEDEIQCISKCPMVPGLFGNKKRDEDCKLNCLIQDCIPGQVQQTQPITKKPVVTAPPPIKSAPLKLAIRGMVRYRATTGGPFSVTAQATPPGGTFSWTTDKPGIIKLTPLAPPPSGLASMPGVGPAPTVGARYRLTPLKPGAVVLTVRYRKGAVEAAVRKHLIIVPPTLFLHGLASDARTWDRIKAHLEKNGWRHGGRLCITCIKPKAGDFYTADFLDNQDSFVDQGNEVKIFVERILRHVDKAAAAAARRVVLVGHSMGGLASRAYLQAHYYQGNVSGLVTIGTPHLGSVVAQLQFTAGYFTGAKPMGLFKPPFYEDTLQPLFRELGAPLAKLAVAKIVKARANIELDPNAPAIRDLAVASANLSNLTRSAKTRLPRKIKYVSVIGVMPRALADSIVSSKMATVVRALKISDPGLAYLVKVFAKTDFLVAGHSQNLNNIVPGIAKEIRTKAVHCCYQGLYGAPGQIINETDQTDVILEAMAATGLYAELPQ